MMRILLTILFLLFGAVFLLQTPMAKQKIKEAILQAAKEEKIDLSIGSVQGEFPFECRLKDIKMQMGGQTLKIAQMKLRFALLPLFKKRIEISHLKVVGGHLGQLEFEAAGRGRYYAKTLFIDHLLIHGDKIHVRFNGAVRKDLLIQDAALSFTLADLALFPQAEGKIRGMGRIDHGVAHLQCTGEEIKLYDHPFARTTLLLDAVQSRAGWEGVISLDGGLADIPLQGKTQFYINTEECAFKELSFTHPELSVKGQGLFHFDTFHLQGSGSAHCTDLKLFSRFLPQARLEGGEAQMDLSFESLKKFSGHFEVKDLSSSKLFCKEFHLDADSEGGLVSEAKQIVYNEEIRVDEVKLSSHFECAPFPFLFFMKGQWRDPFELTTNGNIQKREEGLFVKIQELFGFAFKKPLSLTSPFSLTWDPDHFKMSHCAMDVGSGYFFSQIDLNRNSSLIKLHGESFPLQFLIPPPKHFTIDGTAAFDLELISWKESVQGTGTFTLKQARLQAVGAQEPIVAKGSLQMHVQNSLMQFHGEFKAKDEQYLQLFGSIPIAYSLSPFKFSFVRSQPFSMQLIAEGRSEQLINLINTGPHRISGPFSTRLFFSKTLDHPYLQGEVLMENGVYENDLLGIHLEKLNLQGRAVDQTIYIENLTAQDTKEGKLEGEGVVTLSKKEFFPFILRTHLQNLDTISFDVLVGKFNGDLILSGNGRGAIAKGDLTVADATFRIPDTLPKSYTELPITFINKPDTLIDNPKKHSSPLNLDIQLDAPRKAFVQGKGLNCELKGKLHVTGTYTDIRANGQLQMIKGEYLFAGKVFTLNEGEIVFHDKPTPSSYISLSGNCDLPEVNVTAILRGPLSSPQLSFQSTPHLSTSALLAQILFNKDISQISALQAIQLAQTVISLSTASSNDIFERIRRTLGIDRLNLISSDQDPNKISLQIGKALMRGVMLTFSQGTSNRNLSLEVALRKGLLFQAEINENTQGKFSLKWYYRY